MIWAIVSSWSCFCWLYRASPSLAAKNIVNMISVLTIWWCPCVKSSLVVLEKTLESPLDFKEIQPIWKEINLEYSLEGLMLKLKLQYFGHLMRKADSLEKILMLEKTEGRRRRGRQKIKWLDGIFAQWTCVWANSRRWWRTRKLGMLKFMRLQRIRPDLETEQDKKKIVESTVTPETSKLT